MNSEWWILTARSVSISGVTSNAQSMSSPDELLVFGNYPYTPELIEQIAPVFEGIRVRCRFHGLDGQVLLETVVGESELRGVLEAGRELGPASFSVALLSHATTA